MKPKARIKRMILGIALFGGGALGVGIMIHFERPLAAMFFALLACVGAIIAQWPSRKPPRDYPSPGYDDGFM